MQLWCGLGDDISYVVLHVWEQSLNSNIRDDMQATFNTFELLFADLEIMLPRNAPQSTQQWRGVNHVREQHAHSWAWESQFLKPFRYPYDRTTLLHSANRMATIVKLILFEDQCNDAQVVKKSMYVSKAIFCSAVAHFLQPILVVAFGLTLSYSDILKRNIRDERFASILPHQLPILSWALP